MKKLKVLLICCLFFGSVNAQMYDGSMFFRQYPTFEKMTSKGQDSVFHYFRMSMDGKCKIFEDPYLQKTSLGVLKSEFHAFFKEKLCAADLVILDAHWDNKIEINKAEVIEYAPLVRKKLIILNDIKDTLIQVEAKKLRKMHEDIARKVTPFQLAELKSLYVKGFQNYQKRKLKTLNSYKIRSFDIDSSEYNYEKTLLDINEKYTIENFAEDLYTPSFLDFLNIEDYYFQFALFENKTYKCLLNNGIWPTNLSLTENIVTNENISNKLKISSLMFFIGENYPELKLENKMPKLQYLPKVPFIESDLDIQKMVLKDSLTTLGFIVDREKQKYHLNFSRFIQNEIIQGNFSLMPSVEEKQDLVNQINEASRGEDYKLIQNNDEDLIYIFRFVEDHFEIQAFKIKNGDAVGLLMFIKTNDKPDIETIVKQYMSLIKL